jgi:hypothetical protein
MDIFTFGKYKGYRVDDVIEINPKYVRWAEENVSGFSLTKEQKERITYLIRSSFKPSWIYSNDIDDELEDDLRTCFDPNF